MFVSFFYPVATPCLWSNISAMPEEELVKFNANPAAYIEQQAAALDALTDFDWAPPLDTLDELIGALELEENAPGGQGWVSASYVAKVMEATATNSELPALSFFPVEASNTECAGPDAIMEQEQGFFARLDSVAYYYKMGGMMMMLDEELEPLLMFAAAS